MIWATGRKAVLTRYPEGILLERSGAEADLDARGRSISGVRTERAMAGKVIPGRGGRRSSRRAFW